MKGRYNCSSTQHNIITQCELSVSIQIKHKIFDTKNATKQNEGLAIILLIQ